MKTFLTVLKAYNKQFIIFQVFNLFMVVILRTTGDIRLYSNAIGISTSAILLISLIAYDYPILPIRFKEMMKSLIIGYLYYDIFYIIGFISFGFHQLNEGFIIITLFHVFTIYCYFIFFSTFRTKGSNSLHQMEENQKDDVTTKELIYSIIKLIALIICIGTLKYTFSDLEISNNSWQVIVYVAVAVLTVFNLKLVVSPIVNSYKKLMNP